MLTALYNGKTLYIEQMNADEWKRLSDAKVLRCPDCDESLVFKAYNERTNHFAHAKRDCTYPFREPESLEHESGKQALFDWLKTQFSPEDCQIEQHITQTNQRADTFVSSIQTAVEFQCSVIQATTWHTRHALYNEAAIEDIWILGYSMHKRHHESNRFVHKLNPLEQTLLNLYGKVVYYDFLSKQFVFLYVEEKSKNQFIGAEYRFNLTEVCLQDGHIQSKYDYFINMQQKRVSYATQQQRKAKQTDAYLKDLKEEVIDAKKILASKKQINYIKYLLYQSGKTIPYKLHGLKQEEADVIIKKLIEKNKKVQ